MDQTYLYEFEAKCIQEEAPACQSACPIHVDARAFAKLMAEGQIAKAKQLLDKAMPLSCLTVFLCEGICKNACRLCEVPSFNTPHITQSNTLDKNYAHGLDVNLLERFCVTNTQAPKMMPFPSSRKKIAVIGGGLSSLVLAYELNKKGHQCTLFYSANHPIGTDILVKAPLRLPHALPHEELKNALEKALEILKTIKVSFQEIPEISLEFLNSCIENEDENFRAVFLAYDDSAVQKSDIFIQNLTDFTPHPVSLVTKNPKVLCGGFCAETETAPNTIKENVLGVAIDDVCSIKLGASFIQCIADGKRATGSIERIMQGADPSISREKESVQQTKLYTNLDGKQTTSSIIPQDIAHPTLEEAQTEAKRCIDCSCLECVKECTYLAHYKSYPKYYLRQVYNNIAIIKGTRVANAMINTCTQCGLCEKVCPQGLNMGTFLLRARQELVDYKRMPPTAHEFALDDMVSALGNNVQFMRKGTENKETLLESALDHTHKDFMFFSGCQLPAVLPKEVEAVYRHLTKYISVGFHFSCCGIPAQWAGNTALLEKVLQKFTEQWEEAGKPMYIFACSSCAEFFKNHCPEVQQISLWEILAKLPLPENYLPISPINENKFVLHDPCSVREVPETYTSVRALLRTMGHDYNEFTFSKGLTRCCGFGGLSGEVSADVANAFAIQRLEEVKQKHYQSSCSETCALTHKSNTLSENKKHESTQAKQNSSDILVVYCAICRERYQNVGQKAIHLLELLFPDTAANEQITLKSLEEKTSLLKVYERQENRQDFRQSILKNFFLEESTPEEKAMEHFLENIQITISPEVEKILDERRILRTDIVKVLWATKTKEEASSVETNNVDSYTTSTITNKMKSEFIAEDISVFQNTANSHCLAAYRPRQVTYWVEYLLEQDGSYTIFDAYSHRMVVPGVQGKGEEAFFKSCCNSEVKS